MGFTVTSLGSTQSTTGATLVLTTTAACPAGSALVVFITENGSQTAGVLGTLVASAGGTPVAQNSGFVGGVGSVGNAQVWTIDKTTANLPSGGTLTYTKK